jgi:hypothetical protein
MPPAKIGEVLETIRPATHREIKSFFIEYPPLENFKIYGLVKSHKIPLSVIPAKAGIQSFQGVVDHLDSGFYRSDNFLRMYQN